MKKFFILLFLCTVAFSKPLTLSCAAGYKVPMMKIIKAFEEETSHEVEPMFGNMKKSTAHAKSANVDLIIGDKYFLEKRSKLKIFKYIQLGEGKLVLAYKKGVEPTSLTSNKIEKIALPQPKKAIYGKAAKEWLENKKIYNKIQNKLYIVATIPQVATYLSTGEVDAGLLNLTAAIANKKRFGKIKILNNDSPIDIVAGSLKKEMSFTCKEFVKFIQSKKAKEIFKTYGL